MDFLGIESAWEAIRLLYIRIFAWLGFNHYHEIKTIKRLRFSEYILAGEEV